MRIRLALVPVLVLLTACTSVASIHPIVAEGSSIDEPRLLGDWQLIHDEDTTFIQVTQAPTPSGPAAPAYLFRITGNGSDTTRFVGRLGPFGPGTSVLEITPASASAWEGYNGLVLPGYHQVVVRRTAAGLDFSWFDTDSLSAALEAGRLQTPYIRSRLDDNEIFLTGESTALRAALVSFATRPGTLIPIARTGQTLTVPGDR